MENYYVKDFEDFLNDLDTLWDLFVDYSVCSEETLRVITSINGYNLETLKDVLYAAVGLRSLEQFIEEYEIDPEDRPDLFYDDDSYQE